MAGEARPIQSDTPDVRIVSRYEHEGQAGTEVLVHLEPDVAAFIEEFAHTDMDRELGGVLLGTYNVLNGSYLVSIKAAIEGRHMGDSQTNVTFTKKSWDYIDSARDKHFPDLQIVGWFHTHPGYGVFLSKYDVFLHKSSFPEPWQVAYVTDPIARKAGIFGWYKEELSPVPYESGGRLFTPQVKKNDLPLKLQQPVEKERLPLSRKINIVPLALGAAAVALVTYTGLSLFNHSASTVSAPRIAQTESERPKRSMPLPETVKIKTPSLPTTNRTTASPEQTAEAPVAPKESAVKTQPPRNVSGKSILPMVPRRSSGIAATGIDIGKKPVYVEYEENTVKTSNSDSNIGLTGDARVYKVVRGDCLWLICKRMLGKPTRYPEVAKINQIHRPSLIYTGQVIKVPTE